MEKSLARKYSEDSRNKGVCGVAASGAGSAPGCDAQGCAVLRFISPGACAQEARPLSPPLASRLWFWDQPSLETPVTPAPTSGKPRPKGGLSLLPENTAVKLSSVLETKFSDKEPFTKSSKPIVSCLVCVLGTELRSSGRAASIPNPPSLLLCLPPCVLRLTGNFYILSSWRSGVFSWTGVFSSCCLALDSSSSFPCPAFRAIAKSLTQQLLASLYCTDLRHFKTQTWAKMGRRQCKSAYNIIKNKTTPESSPPPTPKSDYCNADKAEENDLKKSLMKMLEEAFEEKMKNVSKEIGENTNKKLEEINKEIEEKKSKKLEEMNNEIEEKKNKRVEEMNKEIEEKRNKKLQELDKEIEEKINKKLKEMNKEIEEKTNKKLEEINKEIEEKTNKKLEKNQ
ncbi:hypothetical protein STEG23_029301 [Scotinomys teguina]